MIAASAYKIDKEIGVAETARRDLANHARPTATTPSMETAGVAACRGQP